MQRGTTEEDKQLLRAALVLPGQLTQSLLLWRGFEQASIILPFGSERFFVLQDCYIGGRPKVFKETLSAVDV